MIAIALAIAGLTAAMVLSPLTIVMLVALVATTVWAVNGLDGTERRVVICLLVVAIVVRVAMVAGLFLASDPSHVISFPFDGDGLWVKRRALWIRNTWLGVPIHTRDLEDAFTLYGWSSYIYVLAYLQYLFGPSPYAVHLVSIWCHITASVLLFRLVRRAYGPIAAIAGLSVMLFLPSLLMWSVAAMRESFYFLALAAMVTALVTIVRAERLARGLAACAAFAAVIWLLTTIRNGALPLTGAAVGLTLIGTFVTRRPYILLLVLVLVIPVASYLLNQPDVQATVTEQAYRSATTHRGNVVEKGHSYKLLDERFYWPPVKYVPGGVIPAQWSLFVRTITWPEVERYLARALVTSVTVPWPWQAETPSELVYIPQQMFWYVLMALAVIGAVAGCKSDVFVTWVFLGLVGVSIALMAPSEGNIGTLVRHRDTIVPFLACLSGAGVATVMAWAGGWASLPRRAPVKPAGRWRIAADRSRSARLLRGSVFARGVAAFFRPVVGYGSRGTLVRLDTMEGLLAAIATSRVGHAVEWTVNRSVRAWRLSTAHALTAAIRDDVQALEPSARIRVAAFVVCASSLLAGPLGYAIGQAWPTAIAWAVTVIASVLVMLGARGFVTAAAPASGMSTRRTELTV